MAKRQRKIQNNEIGELLEKILITQLCIVGVPQREIARIVGKSLGSVNMIAKYVKLPKK